MENLETPRDLEAWRSWLREHHSSRDVAWVRFERTPGGLSYEQAVLEALAWGWVDSLIKHIDDRSYARKFTPRRPDSEWSASNRARVARLLEEGRMQPAGQRLVDAAVASGRWEQDPRPVISPELCETLEAALQACPEALSTWERLPPSHQRRYLGYIADARRPETRARRVQETLARLTRGETLGLK